jgi:hypothetical protein
VTIGLPLAINRLADTSHETYGLLIDAEQKQIAVTLERPWLGNAPDVSCIPPGTYPLRRAIHHPGTPGAFECFEIADVPGRTYIHIHPANLVAQLEGCVALGESFDRFGQVGGDVANSRAAFDAFMAAMQGIDETTITVLAAPEQAVAA